MPDPRRGGITLVKPITGGLLAQSRDNGAITLADLKVVTRRQPTEQELKDCLFAWTVARHVKSNAIVYARDGITAGIGAGQIEPPRFEPDRRDEGGRSGREDSAGRRAGRSVARSPPMRFSPSPMACSPPPKPGRAR